MYGKDCIVLDGSTVKRYVKSKRINEAAKVQGVYSDEGLYDFFASFRDYKRISDSKATKILGWPVVDYLLSDIARDPFFEVGFMEDDGHLMKGRANTVSYGGAVMTGDTTLAGGDKKHMKELSNIVDELGWDILKWMGVGPNRKSQVVVIPSHLQTPMSAKVNEDIVIRVQFNEEFGAPAGIIPSPSRKGVKKAKKRKDKSIYTEKEEYTFGSDWMPTSLAQRKKMKRIHRKPNRSIREQENNIEKLVAIYPGRFQPFGPHHKASYEFLKSRFDEVYIVTSNKTGGTRHPMNFSQKKRHMMKMGIPSKAIVQDKQVYAPKSLMKKFDENTTAFVFGVGQKDEGRLSGGKYFKPYRQNYNRLMGFKHHGYTLQLPHSSIRVGGMEISGTTMRKLLGSEKFDVNMKKKFFKKLFGYFDPKVFDLFTTSFKEEIKLDVNVGDTILVGRFKNKKIKVKDIGKDKHGMPTINGRKIVNFRKLTEKKETFRAINKDSGKVATFDSEKARDAAIERGTHDKVDKPKVKAPKVKFKAPKVKIPSFADLQKKKADKKAKYGNKPRKPNIVDGVDVIRDEDDLEHFKYKFTKEAETVDDVNDYGDRVAEQYRSQKENMPEDQRRQLEDDAQSWKKLGGYEAIQDAIRNGEISEQDIRDRNERMSEIAHTSVIKAEQPIERGIVIPTEDADTFLERFVEGEMVEIPDESGHGSSGFSLSARTARFFSKPTNDYEDETSILIRIEPNENGEIRGLYIDGEDNDFASEQELIRSSKSKARVKSIEKIKYPSGKMVIIITLQEPNELTESTIDLVDKEVGDDISKKYLEGPLNPGSRKKDEAARVPRKKGQHRKSSKHSDLYTDENPKGTIKGLKFATVKDAQKSVNKIRSSGKSHAHKIQAAVAMEQRAKEMGKKSAAAVYRAYINKMKEKTKKKNESIEKELLLMGGAYGHMAHPFDDYALTFGELKDIIDLGLQGKLDKEEAVTEKLDGQNIMISVVDGKAKAARNKGDLKSGGMDLKGVKAKFKNHIPSVRDAFVFSMRDIASSIERMSKKDQDALFNNGTNWANIEIIYPENKNVIDYDGPATIVFHGILKYNQAWTPSGEVKSGGAKLAAIINKVNGAIKTKFAFKGPNVITMHKDKDYTAKKSKYIGALSKLQNIYRLKDSDELSLYHQHFWLEYILNGANSSDFTNIPDNILYPLMKRWAFSDKSYKMTEINKLKGEYPKFVDWVKATEKLDHAKMLKNNMKPFEEIFFGVGAEILANASNFLSANPEKTAKKLRDDLNSASKSLMAKKDFSNIDKLTAQLKKLKAMPSLSKAAPSEGLVFKYNGKVFKFTGFFAPINQILGLQKFSR